MVDFPSPSAYPLRPGCAQDRGVGTRGNQPGPGTGRGSAVRAAQPDCGHPHPASRTVAAEMVTRPLVHPASVTVSQARAALADPHRHLLLIVTQGRLLGTLNRVDLLAEDDAAAPALDLARLWGRTVPADALLAPVHADMLAAGERRRAVVHPGGDLLGLLCLKASGTGFCTDEGLAARAHARR